MMWIDYQKPKDISEALRILREADGRVCVIAEGTDLILQLKKKGEYHTGIFVDITGRNELKRYGKRMAELGERWIKIEDSIQKRWSFGY